MKQRHTSRKKGRISRHIANSKQSGLSNSATVGGYDFEKPREEIEYERFYPDLDIKEPLSVYVVKSADQIKDVGVENVGINGNSKTESRRKQKGPEEPGDNKDNENEFYDASEGPEGISDGNSLSASVENVKRLIETEEKLSSSEKKRLLKSVKSPSSLDAFVQILMNYIDSSELASKPLKDSSSNIAVTSRTELKQSFRSLHDIQHSKRNSENIDEPDRYTLYNKKRKFFSFITEEEEEELSSLQSNQKVQEQNNQADSISQRHRASPKNHSPSSNINSGDKRILSALSNSTLSLQSPVSTPNSSVDFCHQQHPKVSRISLVSSKSGIREENCINKDLFLNGNVSSESCTYPTAHNIKYPYFARQLIPKPSLDLILESNPNLVYQQSRIIQKSFFAKVDRSSFDYSSNANIVNAYLSSSDFKLPNYESLSDLKKNVEITKIQELSADAGKKNKPQSGFQDAESRKLVKLNRNLLNEDFLNKLKYFGYRQYYSEERKGNSSNTYIRDNDSMNIESFEFDSFEELAVSNKLDTKGFTMFRCLYDMDEQDDYLLSILNKNRVKSKESYVSPEIFEICMTFLEKEWYFLSKRIPRDNSSKEQSEADLKYKKSVEFANIYGSDDGIGMAPENDQPCAICNDSECDNQNAIVFCDGCNIAVHQECYGVVFIPEGQWLCRRCMHLKRKKVTCEFCPSVTGAFKQTDSGLWSHLLCALWIPELGVKSNIYMETVDGIERIPKSRWKLVCYICKQRQGACIQCANKNCFQAFHVTCAKRAGLYLKMHGGVQGVLQDKKNLTAFCERHLPDNSDHGVVEIKKGIEKTRCYFGMLNSDKSVDEGRSRPKYKTLGDGISYFEHANILKKKSSRHMVSAVKNFEQGSSSDKENGTNSSSINYNYNPKILRWQSKNGTPIAPQLFLNRLMSLLRFLQVEEIGLQKLAESICKYWALKREWKTGPLIKTVDTYNLSNIDTAADAVARLEANNVLNNDIHKLIDVSEDIIKRQKLTMAGHSKEMEIFESKIALASKDPAALDIHIS